MTILFININKITENSKLWNKYFELFSNDEKIKIKKYIKVNDRKRYFASIILQNYVIKKHFNTNFGSIDIKKNKYEKPYVDNFEYNVSHDEDIVIIITDPKKSVGIDIMSINRNIDIESLKFIFTENEYKQINNLKEFLIFWCLKESYIKAIGQGLNFDLNRMEFNIKNKDNITLHIDGNIVPNLYFTYFIFKLEYIVAIAQQTYIKTDKPMELDIDFL
jgi:4'-phosphopantetheinyl transferase